MITRWPPHVTGDMPNKTGDLGQAGQPRLNNKLRGCRTTRDLENATCWDTKFWAVESDLRGRTIASAAPGALVLVSMRSYATVSLACGSSVLMAARQERRRAPRATRVSARHR